MYCDNNYNNNDKDAKKNCVLNNLTLDHGVKRITLSITLITIQMTKRLLIIYKIELFLYIIYFNLVPRVLSWFYLAFI